jgi:hypothetical protein
MKLNGHTKCVGLVIFVTFTGNEANVNVKLSLRLTKYHDMKTYGGVEV